MLPAAPPRPVRLLRTTAHACGYWPDRSARNVVLDSVTSAPGEVFPELLAAGFRRSGEAIYRPRCDACNACVPIRLPVSRFRLDRAQRRCLARNADLRVTLEPARCDHAIIDLYRRYLDARHPGSGMSTDDAGEFGSMFLTAWVRTSFLCVRAGPELLAVAITDLTRVGCSAVYTFFDPAVGNAARGLGTFSILAQVALTRALGLPHLYLGYWIEAHPNMHYKARFREQEHLRGSGWQDAGS